MKNIYETKKNGKKYWVVGYTDPFTQKETRRFFKNRELARQFNRNSNIETDIRCYISSSEKFFIECK